MFDKSYRSCRIDIAIEVTHAGCLIYKDLPKGVQILVCQLKLVSVTFTGDHN